MAPLAGGVQRTAGAFWGPFLLWCAFFLAFFADLHGCSGFGPPAQQKPLESPAEGRGGPFSGSSSRPMQLARERGLHDGD